MKKCQGCELEQPDENFPTRKDRSDRLRPYCYSCGNSISRARYHRYKISNPFKWKCGKTKSRARSLKIPFDLTSEYLESIWTGYCPISLVKLQWDTSRLNPDAAELDRIIPELGYVKGNVVFLSRRINRIKSDASFEEIKKLGEWLGSKVN